MIKPFEFYFDFGSPYSFLAHKEIRKIEKKYTTKIKYMPVLLGRILKMAGTKANVDVPIKAKYMIKDCKLWAEKNNILFKFNNYFPIITLSLMRCVLVAEKKEISNNFINNVFDAIWEDGLNMNDTNIVEKLLKNLGINPKIFLMNSTTPEVKEDLKKRTAKAFEKGVFGVPTFIVNNKNFWGQDRLDFALNEAKK